VLGSWIKKQGCYFVLEDLWLDGAGLVTANIYCEGNLKLSRTIIVGWLYAKGDINLTKRVFVEGEVYAGRNIKLHQDITIEGDVFAAGTIKIGPGSGVIGYCLRNYDGPWPPKPGWTFDINGLQNQPNLVRVVK